MSGVIVSNDLMNMLAIFCLAILLHDDIIDWRYFAWRYYAGDIMLAIFCWRYFFRTPYVKLSYQVVLDTHDYFIFVYLTKSAPGFWFDGGNIGQDFIHEFLSSPVLQWRRQNFGSGRTFSKNVLIKDF